MILTINSKKHGNINFSIDEQDYDLIKKYNWTLNCIDNKFYIEAYDSDNKKRIRLHRFLTDCPQGLYVDHIDGDTLNNCRDNLRICTAQQNIQNSRKRTKIKTSSYYKGVCFDKSRNKYMAHITVNYKRKHIGRYDTEDQAAIAYNIEALKHHGEFAKLNNIMAMKRTIQ